MLPKVNNADMAIEKYLRSHLGVVRAPLVYITRKTIKVQMYDDYPRYTTSD